MAVRRRISNEERTALLEELRLGRYYRRKNICARFGISRSAALKIENAHKLKLGGKP
jgi:hypothetical protein